MKVKSIMRCVQCNAVNHDEVAEGDSTYHAFFEHTGYRGSDVPAFFCHACETEHMDIMSEWDREEEEEDE